MSDFNIDPPNYRGPGIYRHYKGGTYYAYGLALQEDTVHKPDDPRHPQAEGREMMEKTFVIYKPMTPGSLLEDRPEGFWARELGDFNEMVKLDGGNSIARFTFVSAV